LIIPSMIDPDGDSDPSSFLWREFEEVDRWSQKDHFFYLGLTLHGEKGCHEPAKTGAYHLELGLAREDAVQFVHSYLKLTREVRDNHVGESFLEKDRLRTPITAFQAMYEYSCRHGSSLKQAALSPFLARD
jgi:hypothetical protein